MASLHSLPVELLLQIHLVALDPVLPRVSAHIRNALASNATPLYRADWLQAKLSKDDKAYTLKASKSFATTRLPNFLSSALRYPICDPQTLSILESRCLAVVRATGKRKHKESMAVVKDAIKLAPPQLPTVPPMPSGRMLSPEQVFQEPSCKDLASHLPPKSVDVPKRIFRNLGSSGKQAHTRFDEEDLPFLRHILDNLAGNADASKGYALAKAVLARHLPLIRLLLARGADPSLKDSMSVMLAIGRNDTEVVKLLVERSDDGEQPSSAEASQSARTAGSKKRKRDRGMQGGSPGKKRRLEDRLPITSAMLELAVRQKCEPLIQYFMAKGAVPNIKTLSMLQG